MEMSFDVMRPLLPKRPDAGHKGDYGHTYIIAGARGYLGAARLCTEGALRSGTGLVTLSVPFPLGDAIATVLLEAMTFLLPSTHNETFAQDALEHALTFAKDKQAVAIGPGITRHPETAAFVQDFVQTCPAPLVIDADGLNAISEQIAVLSERQGPCVVTPHPGEMARLAGSSSKEVQADRQKAAIDFAQHHGCVVVLKGHRTVIASPEGECSVNTTGNSGMGTGGTGDVLTGLIAGLLAQGCTPYDAARLGVFVHGLAGDLAAEKMGQRSMLARDALAAIGLAFMRLESSAA